MDWEMVYEQSPFLIFSRKQLFLLCTGFPSRSTGFPSRSSERADVSRSCRPMFASFVVFGQSVFSPERKPMILQRAKPLKRMKAAPRAEDFISAIGPDALDLVLMAVYQICEHAPMCAAVSREFKRAKEVAEIQSKELNVAPHRLHMKIASEPSLIPSVEEDKALIQTWGENLESYIPVGDILYSCDRDDMRRILDMQGARGNGWLSNFAVDKYMSKLIPQLIDAKPGAPRVFLPGVHSISLLAKGTLGFKCYDGDTGEIDVEQTNTKRAQAVSVLAGAEEIYANFNLGDYHWALMRVSFKYRRCEIYDSTGHTKKMHGRLMLLGIQELTGVDVSKWAVVAYEAPASGMAQQKDGKSCGVFLCITAAHILSDAKLPDIQADIQAWRRHIASAVAPA